MKLDRLRFLAHRARLTWQCSKPFPWTRQRESLRAWFKRQLYMTPGHYHSHNDTRTKLSVLWANIRFDWNNHDKVIRYKPYHIYWSIVARSDIPWIR